MVLTERNHRNNNRNLPERIIPDIIALPQFNSTS